MTARAFEPGWEIGIRNGDATFLDVGTVARITYQGHIIVRRDDDGREIEFDYTGEAVDAGDHQLQLVALSREWRAARRMEMIYKRLESLHWRDWEDSLVKQVYDLLERKGAWEWCEDQEEDYSASIRI